LKAIQFHTKFTFVPQNKSNGRKTHSFEGESHVRQLNIIGVGSGWGARNMGAADGPKVLLENSPPSFRQFPQSLTYWHHEPLSFHNPGRLPNDRAIAHADHVFEMVSALCLETKESVEQGEIPIVLGGDHSMAIGTWSGIKAALPGQEMGLIWIDAHMDAHTPETSPSLNVHGMPLAALLGQGESRYVNLGVKGPVVKPENLFLVGIRSFEEGEALLLRRLGVRVYSVKEVQERGLVPILHDIRTKLSTHRFGLSIDVDAFDPEEAPGTGTPEALGLRFSDVKEALYGLAQDPAFLALEIAEFNPHKDVNNKTCQLVWDLVSTVTGGLYDKE
jgi:arginase